MPVGFDECPFIGSSCTFFLSQLKESNYCGLERDGSYEGNISKGLELRDGGNIGDNATLANKSCGEITLVKF